MSYRLKLVLAAILGFIIALLLVDGVQDRSAKDKPISGYVQEDIGVQAPARALR